MIFAFNQGDFDIGDFPAFDALFQGCAECVRSTSF
jgi:hypothetical protein